MSTISIASAKHHKERGASVSGVISSAEDMNYDSIFILGVKDGELSAGWSTDNAFELLGALEMAKKMYKEEIE